MYCVVPLTAWQPIFGMVSPPRHSVIEAPVDCNFIPDDGATEVSSCVERAEQRDSMFLMAAIRRPGGHDVSVKVRNLSAGGMMAESAVSFVRGEEVELDLRGVGTISGRVVWGRAGRIGISFDVQIDPRVARKALAPAANPSHTLLRASKSMWRPPIR